jgi:uncharacterized protein (DUF983 family)
MNKDKKQNLLVSVLQERCPNCGKGHVFKQNISLLQLPVMNESCEKCKYHFDREPGYFLGAMYLSYGLAALQGILTFFICHFLFAFLVDHPCFIGDHFVGKKEL